MSRPRKPLVITASATTTGTWIIQDHKYAGEGVTRDLIYTTGSATNCLWSIEVAGSAVVSPTVFTTASVFSGVAGTGQIAGNWPVIRVTYRGASANGDATFIMVD